MQCWAFCPDNVISRAVPPAIDLEYCKGCGICAAVCPSEAIEMRDENHPGSTTLKEDVSCGC